MLITCCNCRAQLKAEDKFCGSCGILQPGVREQMLKSCAHCGARLISGDKFCGSCGRQQSNTEGEVLNSCAICGAHLSVQDRFCSSCGAPRPSTTEQVQNLCRNCRATLTVGDKFCGSCGAPQISTMPQQAASAFSTEEPWYALLDPGEQPVLIVRDVALRVLEKMTSTLLGYRAKWQRHRVDAVVVTGQRLMCTRKGKILEFVPRRRSRWGPYRRPASFTIDPAIVKVWSATNRKRSEAIMTAFRQQRQQEGLVKAMFSPSEEYWNAATEVGLQPPGQNRYPPLVWIWGERHRLRPLGLWWRWVLYPSGCLALLVSAFTFGLAWPVFLSIFALFILVSLPFRLRSWTGIQLTGVPALKRTPYGSFEIEIFDEKRVKELLDFLQPRAANIYEILKSNDQLLDFTVTGALAKAARQLGEAFKKD
jgi:hypothetical protein